jgi:hypothetical protein
MCTIKRSVLVTHIRVPSLVFVLSLRLYTLALGLPLESTVKDRVKGRINFRIGQRRVKHRFK